MHDTEYRCATVVAQALGIELTALVEADMVLPHDGEAHWHDGDGEIEIHAGVSGKINVTFDKWHSSLELKPDHRPHYWILRAAMAAVEEAREIVKEVTPHD